MISQKKSSKSEKKGGIFLLFIFRSQAYEVSLMLHRNLFLQKVH